MLCIAFHCSGIISLDSNSFVRELCGKIGLHETQKRVRHNHLFNVKMDLPTLVMSTGLSSNAQKITMPTGLQ